MALTIENYNAEELKTELEERFENAIKKTYPDFSFATSEPLSNIMNLIIKIVLDLMEDRIEQQSQINVLEAEGDNLDILAFNRAGLLRKKGVKTQQEIQITISSPCVIYGLDNSDEAVFTIADNNNNNYKLLNTKTYSSAGTYTETFQAEEYGPINSTTGSIVNIITNIVGVSSVINNVSATTIGEMGEDDAIFRNRILLNDGAQNTSILNSITQQLKEIEDVIDAKGYINRTENEVNGLPSRNIYFIIEGGSADKIAEVLSNNLTTEIMFGEEEYILELENEIFEVKFDRPESLILYVKFDIESFQGELSETILNNLKNYLIENINFEIGKKIISSSIFNQITNFFDEEEIDANVSDVEMSIDNTNWLTSINPTLLKNKFSLISNNITITQI